MALTKQEKYDIAEWVMHCIKVSRTKTETVRKGHFIFGWKKRTIATYYEVFKKDGFSRVFDEQKASRNPESLNKEECEAEIRNFAKQSVLKCYKDNKKLIDALGNKKDGVTLRPICGRHLRVVKEGE